MSRGVPFPNVLNFAWLKIAPDDPMNGICQKFFSGLGDGLHKIREPVRKKSPSRARGQASNENKKFVVIGVPLPPSACNIILHTFIL
jgi:hypothetical protein